MITRTDAQLDEVLGIARKIDDLERERDQELTDLRSQVGTIEQRYEAQISALRGRLRTLWSGDGPPPTSAARASQPREPAAAPAEQSPRRAGTLAERILGYLASRPGRTAELPEIAEAAYGANDSKHRNLTGSVLWRLAKKEQVVKLGRSRWSLP